MVFKKAGCLEQPCRSFIRDENFILIAGLN